MKKALLIPLLLLAQSAIAHASTITIKNNTIFTQQLALFQDGKLIGYVDRLKPGKVLTVKTKDSGSRILVSFTYDGDRKYALIPDKSIPYTVTRFIDWVR